MRAMPAWCTPMPWCTKRRRSLPKGESKRNRPIASLFRITSETGIRIRLSSFPVLRWVIATPEFHHWHHTSDEEGIATHGTVKVVERLAAPCRINGEPVYVTASVGITLYPILFPLEPKQAGRKPGLQSVTLYDSCIVLLPNPSGRNAAYPYHALLDAFRTLTPWGRTSLGSVLP